MNYQPPFKLTHPMLSRVAEIGELLGRWQQKRSGEGLVPQLRRGNRWQPELAYLPVETVVKSRQVDYYHVLGESDKAADCTPFILFMLQAIAEALGQAVAPVVDQTDPVIDPVDQLLILLVNGALAPSAIQQQLGLKHRPTFRANYLRPALRLGLIEMTRPETPHSRLQEYRLTEAGQIRLRERKRS